MPKKDCYKRESAFKEQIVHNVIVSRENAADETKS